MILSNYIEALQQHYDEQQLLDDLENEVTKITKESGSWTQWRTTLEDWTIEIGKWDLSKNDEPIKSPVEYSPELLEDFVGYRISNQNRFMSAIDHISSIFPNYNSAELRHSLNNYLLDFLISHTNFRHEDNNDLSVVKKTISHYIQETDIIKYFAYDHTNMGDNFNLLYTLEPIIVDLLTEIFMCCYSFCMTKKEAN